MKLSEAIRLGSMMKPQGFYRLFDHRGHTCAMGAACEAIGVDLQEMFALSVHVGSAKIMNKYIESGWGELIRQQAPCPECGFIDGYLPITHLNDTHRWTREAIADWVETIEDAQPALQPAEAAVMG